jgi:hypothetical protein
MSALAELQSHFREVFQLDVARASNRVIAG